MLDSWEAYGRGIQKIGWGTSQFSVRAACELHSRTEMVSSGDLPWDSNLASFSSRPIFEFFNTIANKRSLPKGPDPTRQRSVGAPEPLGYRRLI
jgi:hypothetical protein